jgi:hypothetical protein
MPHVTRSRRKANTFRRLMRAKRTASLPLAEQQKRSAASVAATLARYPYPPKYRYRDSDPPPVQPLCYGPSLNPFS